MKLSLKLSLFSHYVKRGMNNKQTRLLRAKWHENRVAPLNYTLHFFFILQQRFGAR